MDYRKNDEVYVDMMDVHTSYYRWLMQSIPMCSDIGDTKKSEIVIIL